MEYRACELRGSNTIVKCTKSRIVTDRSRSAIEEIRKMTKRVPLGRLREISKQRSIRRPHFAPIVTDDPEGSEESASRQVEWPVPSGPDE